MTTLCFTSFTYAYLPRALVLAETLRQAHPDWPLWAVLVDRPPPGMDPPAALAAFAGVVDAEDLGLPRFRAWLFKHEIVEACTAVKGAMLLHLFGHGAERVVYFDPDIALFHPLAALDHAYAAASVVLTPHQTAPNDSEAAAADNELAALRYGVFNLGFLAVRNDPDGRAFAAWWAERLAQACYDDPAHGLFTDQKYCDLAPALFGNVAIARDAGWNVASWNLSRRGVRFSAAGDLEANGEPLAFYHFSKFDGVGARMTERYAAGRPEPRELCQWYARRLAAHAQPAVPPGWWHYGTFSDGAPIPLALRRYCRRHPELMLEIDDPFDCSSTAVRDWLATHAAEILPTA